MPVVFALRPEVGFIGTDWLPLEAGEDPLSPVWYLRIWPDSAADITSTIWLYPPYPPIDPGHHVHCSVLLAKGINTSTWWDINELGEEVEGTRGVGDDYRSNQMLEDGDPDKLPDPSIFYLAPMEPTEP